MQRRSTTLLARFAIGAALLAIASTGAAADKLYKWKDANGVTHYGDAPPAQGAYEDRQIHRDAATADAVPAADAPAEDPQCAGVRENLELLRARATVVHAGRRQAVTRPADAPSNAAILALAGRARQNAVFPPAKRPPCACRSSTCPPAGKHPPKPRSPATS